MTGIEEDPVISDSVVKAVKEWSTEDIDTTVATKTYTRAIGFKIAFIVICTVVLIFVAGYAVTYGAMGIDFLEVYGIIWDHIFGDGSSQYDYVVWNLRLPRVVMGILAGAGLALCGVIMQSVLRNPLADPYTTGLSSGAAFGASLAVALGLTATLGTGSRAFLAFICSLIPIVVILFVTRRSGSSPTVVIMTGMGIMFLLNSMSTFLMLMADPSDMSQLFYWQVGSLSLVKWSSFPYMASMVIVGIIITMFLAKTLNVLATGDESAKSMGVDADNLRLICLILTGLVCASIVSFTGLIGFIGLVVPHILRMIIGSDNRYLIPSSIVFGATLMLAADLVGRMIIYPFVVPVGVVMSFVGGPIFILLILRRSSKAW